VLYAGRDNDRRTIEYQIQGNRFAFGYRKRIIKGLKIVPLIDWNTDIDTLGLDANKWKRVNMKVNEMGLNTGGSK
jgi:hypothetical protein